MNLHSPVTLAKQAAGFLGLLAAAAAITLPVAAQIKPQVEIPGTKPSGSSIPSTPTLPSSTTPSLPTVPNAQTPVGTPGTSGTQMNAPTSPGMSAPSMSTPSGRTQTSGSTSTATTGKTIVDVASASNSFKTLVAALKEAELTEVLKGKGPFTVFAPTDAAFAALPPGTVDELLKPENRATLVKILKYHVVAGNYPANRLTSGQVATAEGSSVTVAVKGGKVTVNNANVVQPDIAASNGVIHAIDRVILPPQ
jgi:uncharacterized surface protein with fasciclin (FAS1) repeats